MTYVFYSFHKGNGFSVNFILWVNPSLEGTSYFRFFSDVSGGGWEAQSPLYQSLDAVCREEFCSQHSSPNPGQALVPRCSDAGEDEHSQVCHLPWLGWQLWLPRGSFRVLLPDSHWALISSTAFSFPVAPDKRHALMVRHLAAVLLRRLLIISS